MIIEQAYKVFEQYKAKIPLDVCTNCCMTLENERKLASISIAEIPLELLTEYNDSAKPEKTNIDEVKHFLPRYLDLIYKFIFPSHSPELSFSRLTPFDEKEWISSELEILNQFSVDFFDKCLSIYPIHIYINIDEILIMFWRAKINLDPLLKNWESKDSFESILHFNNLYFYGFKEYNKTKLSNPFSDDELNLKLKKWIESESVKQAFKPMIEKLIVEENAIESIEQYQLFLLYDLLN